MKPIRNILLIIFSLTLSKVVQASQAELGLAIEKLMAGTAGDVQVGIIVEEAETGQVIYSRDAELPLNPASNTKVLSTLAALSSLGPDFTFKTELLGDQPKKGRIQSLTLKGYGDPLLSSVDLYRMAEQLKDRGVREIAALSVDGSYFDEGDFPGQMSGRQRDAGFNCSVGALSVDHNLLFLTVSPGEALGSAAKVEIDPPLPSFPIEGEVLTQKKRGRIIVKNRNEGSRDLGVEISGGIALNSEPLRYRVSIHQPLQLAALRLREALVSQGIALPPETRFAPPPAKSKVLALHRSLPLSLIVQEINKQSDNFMAEQVTKVLGAEFKGAPGTTEKGVAAVKQKLQELGMATQGIEMENGSGLSKVNRFSAKTLAQALQIAYRDPDLRQNFLSSLSVLGVDGTLKRKLRRSDLAGRFLGKTGTLHGVSSLSGYAFPKNSASEAYVYAFIVNGKGKNFWKEKQRGQDILQTLLNW